MQKRLFFILLSTFIILGGITSQNVGIGIDNPISPLHIYKNSSNHVYLTFGNLTTGSTSGNGVLVGLDPNENFRIHSYEENDLRFYTTNQLRMVVKNSGDFILGGESLPGNGDIMTGSMFFYHKPKNAIRFGGLKNSTYWSPDSIGLYSLGFGYNVKASESYSTAWGSLTEAIGEYATAWGFATKAQGKYATSWGFNTEATGEYSTAHGYNTKASGKYSFAGGLSTQSRSFGEASLGMWSTSYTPGNPNGWDLNDRLFSIGNGQNLATTSNALTIMKSGKVGISTDNPETEFHVFDNLDADDDVSLRLQSKGANNDVNIDFYENTAPAMSFQYDGGANKLFVSDITRTTDVRVTIERSGDVGINTTNPTVGLHVHDKDFKITDENAINAILMESDGQGGAGEINLYDADGTPTIALVAAETSGTGSAIKLYDANGDKTIELDGQYNGKGRVFTNELQINGGSDLSEYFDIDNDLFTDVLPGMVVSISPKGDGKLILSTSGYDKSVAGIISGANGVNTGLMMGQKSSIAHGDTPVVLAGRAYVLADASETPILPGDLLTSSDTPGHVMKVKNYDRAQGAIIGKAMTRLENGRGFVLVLVNLQ